jgi:hypothetical protein
MLTRQGIRLSMRITALLGGIELLIMLALAITFLIHPGPGSTYTAPLNPSLAPHHFEGIVAGMVFSILSLSGFEGPAPLAQESRRAGKLRRPGGHPLAAGHRGFLHLHLVRERRGLGHRRHGRLRQPIQIPTTILAMRCGEPGWWLVVLASHQQRNRGRTRLHQLRLPGDVHHGPRGHTPCPFRQDSPGPPNTDVRNRLPADCRV